MNYWSIKQFDKIVELRRKGYDWEDISERFVERSLASTRQFYYRNREKTRQGFPKLSEETKNEIRKLKHEGLSCSQIAAKLGTTKSAIAGAAWRWKL